MSACRIFRRMQLNWNCSIRHLPILCFKSPSDWRHIEIIVIIRLDEWKWWKIGSLCDWNNMICCFYHIDVQTIKKIVNVSTHHTEFSRYFSGLKYVGSRKMIMIFWRFHIEIQMWWNSIKRDPLGMGRNVILPKIYVVTSG